MLKLATDIPSKAAVAQPVWHNQHVRTASYKQGALISFDCLTGKTS